jgi:hypothetical protein
MERLQPAMISLYAQYCSTSFREIRLSNFFHTAAILPQVPIPETGSGTNMDDIVGRIQNEQAVIDKTKSGPELDPDCRGICSCELGVSAPGEDHAQFLERAPGVASNPERFDAMAVGSLAGYAVG